MPGPYHDFLLLSHADCSFSEYSQFIGDPRAIQLDDDFIHYIADSLEWIPTHNPARNESHSGLCLYGPTVIHIDGAESAAAIFDAWAALFSCGPEAMTLTGGWSTIEGTPWSEGRYEKLNLDRDELVLKLSEIANYAEQIIESNGEYFILHLGV